MTYQVRIYTFRITLADNEDSPKSTNMPMPTDSFVFPAQRDRCVLHLGYSCPWAHRINIARILKGLEDIIELAILDRSRARTGGSSLASLVDPRTRAIPVLWYKQRQTIANNGSSEIIRMLYAKLGHLLPYAMREANQPGGGLYPAPLRADIDAMNDWVYDKIQLFETLDRVEEHLGQPGHQPYLFGANITEADIRLYTTIARFDVAYYLIFRCNPRMIRHNYPRIDRWYWQLYYDQWDKTRGPFRKTTSFIW
ncbi:hypothetical protein CNMCM5623_002453 [Aspergillus felis]|uniref:GST C-terminal domain-containing protein n=1 Tax=Aspergillus felis TaxID=1287682 RepID=A0A8H6QC23_9EURO|nr:hypothetical protein CNMCM5623_002453 [Aspergillus felis]